VSNGHVAEVENMIEGGLSLLNSARLTFNPFPGEQLPDVAATRQKAWIVPTNISAIPGSSPSASWVRETIPP
jgi:hypothetical protein